MKRNYHWKSRSYTKENFSASLHSLIFAKCFCVCIKPVFLFFFFPFIISLYEEGVCQQWGGWGWDGRDGPAWFQPAGYGHPCPVRGLSHLHPTHKWCASAAKVWQICNAEMWRQFLGCFVWTMFATRYKEMNYGIAQSVAKKRTIVF